MQKSAPIGIFDSGVGGLTVAKAVANALPKESFIYFGDTAHLPYGEKSNEAITRYSLNICEFLLDQGCKAIVIACNTASAVAFDTLKDTFGHRAPIINVIDPVVEAVAHRDFKNIGIIATRATIQSDAYGIKLRALHHYLEVKSLATPLLVPIIEEGLAQSSISTEALQHYLNHPTLQNIEALILGCTHYPMLEEEIMSLLHNKVQVLNSPQMVAETVSQVLASQKMLNNQRFGSYSFYLSDYTETFARISRQFFGEHIVLKEHKL